MNSLALTAADRAKLAATGAIVKADAPPMLADAKAVWMAALGRARAAFEELRQAEHAYLAASAPGRRFPGKRLGALALHDPYGVPGSPYRVRRKEAA